MAGGGVAALGVKKERAAEYKGRMTWAVAMACLVAAVGGSIFGYDIGISGNFFVSARTRLCCVHGAVCARVWLLLSQPWPMGMDHRKSFLCSSMNIRTCHMLVSSSL
jgi:hypothetical protein